MSKWGLPNWRDPTSYGDVNKWSKERWRWEFTRRRPDYREAFEASAQKSYEIARAIHGPRVAILSPEQPGFCAQTTWPPKFGLAALPNPRISEQPWHVITFTSDRIRFYRGEGPDLPYDGERTAHVDVPENRLAVVFDLTGPIGPQLKTLRNTLKLYQELAMGKKIPVRRRHPKKWFMYLRVLDGRKAGASWDQLTAALPHMRSNVRREPQAAAQVHEAAQALMFNWPD
jgi:hypothetical protein